MPQGSWSLTRGASIDCLQLAASSLERPGGEPFLATSDTSLRSQLRFIEQEAGYGWLSMGSRGFLTS